MDFLFILKTFWALLPGVPMTLSLTGCALIAGGLLALLLATMRHSNFIILRAIAAVYVFIFRGTPLMVQLFIVYYGLGQFRPFLSSLNLWWFFREAYYCSVFTLSLCSAAYVCEIIRGAYRSIPHGQIEAAHAFGMSGWTLFRKITFPLTLRHALPGYSNEVILLLKATSLTSVITISEVTFRAQKMISETYRAIEVFIAAGAIYLVIIFTLTRLLSWLEQYLRVDRIPTAMAIKEARHA